MPVISAYTAVVRFCYIEDVVYNKLSKFYSSIQNLLLLTCITFHSEDIHGRTIITGEQDIKCES